MISRSLSVWALIVVALAVTAQCRRSPELPGTVPGQYDRLKLKEGMKVILSHRILDLDSTRMGEAGRRTVIIEEPSGAEGVLFTWLTSPAAATPSPQPSASPQSEEWVSIPLMGPSETQEGRIALPSILNARRMTLPVFWPQGDLYLSDSAGIWLSDAAFEELKDRRKTQWQPGLLQNPLLGPAQEIPILEASIEKLEQMAQRPGVDPETTAEIKVSKNSEKYLLKINGKEEVVEVMTAENWLARYKILNNAQNPLVLEIQLAPKASPAELLFSPLALLKNMVEYRVEEIITGK
jgi:hypothetical protein